jgi:hypothetical protein
MKKWFALITILAGLSHGLASRTDAGLIIESGVAVSLQNLATVNKPVNLASQSTTFSGTGYVGLRGSDPFFAEALNLEVVNGASHSRTGLQVDISSLLAGKIIQSASLSFLLGSSSGTQSVTARVRSFDANGTLGYGAWEPVGLGTDVTQSVSGSNDPLTLNTIDITSLLQARIAEGKGWLGLQLSATGVGDQYLATTMNDDPDRAQVRLTVNFSSVPEPNSLFLVGAILTLGGIKRIRRRKV